MEGQREAAEAIALDALVFLTQDGERLERFMTSSGLSPDELRRRAGEPEMLAAVLDHLLEDESLLLVFAAEKGLAPEAIGPARAALPGAGSDAQLFAAAHNTSGADRGRVQSKRPSRRWAGPGTD